MVVVVEVQYLIVVVVEDVYCSTYSTLDEYKDYSIYPKNPVDTYETWSLTQDTYNIKSL